MRTSDPAAVLRVSDLTPVHVLPAASVDLLESEADVSTLNLQPGAEYARAQRGRWLSLVTDEVPPVATVEADIEQSLASTHDDRVLAPMAAPLDAVVANLFESPAALAALLQVANEYRRVLDLVATAQQLGAVRLPAAIAERMDRVRQGWPDALAPI